MARRQPLAPVDLNRAYNKELSATQRCQIPTYRAIGLSNEQIGARTFVRQQPLLLPFDEIHSELTTRPFRALAVLGHCQDGTEESFYAFFEPIQRLRIT